MKIQNIITDFINTQIPIAKVTSFSKLPGIYAFFFLGKNFPLDGFVLPKNKIIYIGKTESSQQSRDANTHFKSGKTGSSTVRKSIGALLSQSEQIIPTVRSLSDIEKGRNSHFKFDENSEDRVTEWMFQNLGVAFYEYPETKEKINTLESELINFLKPVLNIDSKNIDNPYKSKIKQLRKQLADISRASFISKNRVLGTRLKTEVKTEPKQINPAQQSTGKYTRIWEAYSKEIRSALDSRILQNKIQLDQKLFKTVGNRKSYSFKLQYQNGKVANNIAGSAVARDLNSFLLDKKFKLNNETIGLTKDFVLIIENFKN